MTFSDRVKKELSGLPVKNSCCRRALAEGLAYGAAKTPDGGLNIAAGSRETAAFIEKMLRDRFGSEIIFAVRQSDGKKSEKVMLTIKHLVTAELAADGRLPLDILCPGCATAFLRGVFISCASVSNPRSASYHAELVPHSAQHARNIYRMLTEIGCAPRIINRKYGTGLYFKDSGVIEELLVKLGANNAAFELMNCKIERAIRNDENRATNCVAKNIAKTVSASSRQVEEIRRLTASGRLEAMPYDIRVTAKLRMENPEASLAELAALHRPPISKSGLNHRLEKIALEAGKNN